MYHQYGTSEQQRQCQQQLSQDLALRLHTFVLPFLNILDRFVDKRLLRTCVETIQAILVFRDSKRNLLLSELGAFVASPEHAPAGTKRISTLLRSLRWRAQLIADFLWAQATAEVNRLAEQNETALVLWDESVWEKPESIHLEGLGSVRSSKAQRLTRIKPGFYQPPKGTVFVPGLNWLALMIVGLHQPPVLAGMQWWSTRGKFKVKTRGEEQWWLGRCMAAWGLHVVHIFDRGFAGSWWLEECAQVGVRFIMRWQKQYQLRDFRWMKRKAWQLSRGKRSQWKRTRWDGKRKRWFEGGIVVVPVTHPQVAGQYWLVVSRPGKGMLPWYLLTNEPVETEDQAWRIVASYARRWDIEMTWRFCKAALGFESPRQWRWEARLKLLMLASLALAFLLSLLVPSCDQLREYLLRTWCHRTGRRYHRFTFPLYRLREALSFLWLSYPPLISFSLNSG